MAVNEVSRRFPPLIPGLYGPQEVSAKRARHENVDDASFLPITPSIGEDGASILLPCCSNGIKGPIDPRLLLIYLRCAHIVVGNACPMITWPHISNGSHHLLPLVIF